MIFTAASQADTEALAARLADRLQIGDIIFLRGPLGSGKTVFARALIRAHSGFPEMTVPSPTFTLVQIYESSGPGGGPEGGQLFHFDLYRIESPEDIYEIGWEDAIADGIAIVEWPERLENLAPPDHLELLFSPLENNPEGRKIEIVSHGRLQARFTDLD